MQWISSAVGGAFPYWLPFLVLLPTPAFALWYGTRMLQAWLVLSGCALVGLLVPLSLWSWSIVLGLYAVTSVIAFLALAHDKRNARLNEPIDAELARETDRDAIRQLGQRRRRRYPELVLHAWEAAGGFPGSLAAQRLFRHKTRKFEYQFNLWTIIAFHAACGIVFLVSGVDPGTFPKATLFAIAGTLAVVGALGAGVGPFRR